MKIASRCCRRVPRPVRMALAFALAAYLSAVPFAPAWAAKNSDLGSPRDPGSESNLLTLPNTPEATTPRGNTQQLSNPTQANPPDENPFEFGGEQGIETDPLEPFNSAMFTFNRKLDDWVLHPLASAYADVAPEPLREAVTRFFDNVDVIPRFANNLFQLRLPEPETEVARFGINSTLGTGRGNVQLSEEIAVLVVCLVPSRLIVAQATSVLYPVRVCPCGEVK